MQNMALSLQTSRIQRWLKEMLTGKRISRGLTTLLSSKCKVQSAKLKIDFLISYTTSFAFRLAEILQPAVHSFFQAAIETGHMGPARIKKVGTMTITRNASIYEQLDDDLSY